MTGRVQLTKNFYLDEFEASQVAARMGIDNTAPLEVKYNLIALCRAILQPYRDAFPSIPVFVSSGFRCDDLNKAVGGSPSSDHRFGKAADIKAMGIGTRDLGWALQAISYDPYTIPARSIPLFDQIIIEFPKDDDAFAGWVHVSHRPDGQNRGQFLETLDGVNYRFLK